jgi:hypothetical protein
MALQVALVQRRAAATREAVLLRAARARNQLRPLLDIMMLEALRMFPCRLLVRESGVRGREARQQPKQR